MVAVAASVAAVSLLLGWRLLDLPVTAGDDLWWATIVSPVLAIAAAASYRYPIHIRHNVKLYMATVPLYLLAVCVSPIPSALVGTAGVIGGELAARKHTGVFASDIVSSGARYCLVMLTASIVVHTEWGGPYPVHLLAGAAAYWLMETITLPIVISPINSESPLQVITAYVREASIAEGTQYGIGFLGGLLAVEYPWSLALLAIPAGLVYGAFKNAKEMHETTLQMLESMADAVDLRDPYTGGHSRRVAEYSAGILRQLNKGGAEADLVVSAARVHDIGKIGLPDSVLLKDGKLSDEEQEVMRTHADAGANLLRRYREFSRGIDVVRHHHERWDGKGYPAGLKGQNIPWGARIVAVADSFDAMTSDRPYRKGVSLDLAARILAEGRGTQWDPEIVDAFAPLLAQMIEDAREVTEREAAVKGLPAALAV